MKLSHLDPAVPLDPSQGARRYPPKPASPDPSVLFFFFLSEFDSCSMKPYYPGSPNRPASDPRDDRAPPLLLFSPNNFAASLAAAPPPFSSRRVLQPCHGLQSIFVRSLSPLCVRAAANHRLLRDFLCWTTKLPPRGYGQIALPGSPSSHRTGKCRLSGLY